MTNLVPRDPAQMLPTLQRQMNRLFQDFFGSDEGLLSSTAGPAVNIYETAEEFVVEAALPGWTRDQVSISFENQTLTLSGQRELPDSNERQYHRLETFYGRFTRSFTLPGVIDPDSVTASLHDGLLTVHLPKRAEARPRQIEVKTVQ
jgi:HSP20 family protein